MGSYTSTATVVEAPPAKADFKSIRQNGTDGDAATWKGYCWWRFKDWKAGGKLTLVSATLR